MTTTKAAATYGDHRVGSRKSKVYKVFVEKGRDHALAFGEKEGLKVATLRSWFSTWNTTQPKIKKPAKKSEVLPTKKPDTNGKKTAKVIPMKAKKKVA